MEPPLVDKEYLLQKYPGKGGWTYAEIPEIPQDRHAWFGWVRVRGSIDGFEIQRYHLMPMGNGKLFLPVRKEIRKKIKKEAGDFVHVILYADNTPLGIPEELLVCLEEEPKAHEKFLSLRESEQKTIVDWIYSAKKEDTKIERIARIIDQLLKGNKLLPDPDDNNI